MITKIEQHNVDYCSIIVRRKQIKEQNRLTLEELYIIIYIEYLKTEVQMDHSIFNTIATLINMSIALLGNESVEEIADEEEVVKSVNEFLSSNGKNNYISLQQENIIKECEKRKDYYFVRAMICQLDLLIDIKEVINHYNFNTMKISSEDEKGFDGLNNNIAESGIIVLPKIRTLKAFSRYKNDCGEYVPKKNANDWLEDINVRLRNIYYVQQRCLSGYIIKNYLLSSVDQRGNKDFIRIGMSPIIKKENLKELFDLDYYYGMTMDGLHKTQLFGIKNILCQELINHRTKLAFEEACKKNCDIFISPEMLGTDELLFTDDEISELFRPKVSNKFQTPFLTLPPTQWKNKKNILTVFNENGERIGEQHKQNRFKMKKSHTNWVEDLETPKNEILLIHIEGWGRFAFPICMDFLTNSYRDILTEKIKATFLLCPSFSKGVYNFDLTSGNDSEFEVRTVWINSCSAYEENDAEYIGLISVPSCLDRSRRTRIKPECNGACKDICLFLVDIPKDCNDGSKNVSVEHICESL